MKAIEMTNVECANWILNRRPDIRESSEYKNAEDVLIDTTMSCDRLEAISFMKSAMRYSKISRNGYEFLAAFDLYNELKEGI